MIVPCADGVGAVFQQQSENLQILFLRGEMCGGSAIGFATDVGIGVPMEEEPDNILISRDDRAMEGGTHSGVATLINDFGVGIEDFRRQIEVPLAAAYEIAGEAMVENLTFESAQSGIRAFLAR